MYLWGDGELQILLLNHLDPIFDLWISLIQILQIWYLDTLKIKYC